MAADVYANRSVFLKFATQCEERILGECRAGELQADREATGETAGEGKVREVRPGLPPGVRWAHAGVGGRGGGVGSYRGALSTFGATLYWAGGHEGVDIGEEVAEFPIHEGTDAHGSEIVAGRNIQTGS